MDSIGIVGYDSFHFVVSDLARSRRFYAEALGFTEVARAAGRRSSAAARKPSVFGAGQIRVLVSTPVRKDSRAARYLRIHPDGISSLAFRVKDVEAAWKFLDARGATFLSDIQTDETPDGSFRTFNIATPLDDVTFRFIERRGDYPRFAPGFETVGDGKPTENPHGFATIDHVTSNAYTMLPVVNWYRDVLGFTHYWDVEFHTSEVGGGPDAWRARACAPSSWRTPGSGVKFATNEPMRPFFRESQINRFCEDHHGAGVQHVAFLVKEIIPAVEALREKGIAVPAGAGRVLRPAAEAHGRGEDLEARGAHGPPPPEPHPRGRRRREVHAPDLHARRDGDVRRRDGRARSSTSSSSGRATAASATETSARSSSRSSRPSGPVRRALEVVG